MTINEILEVCGGRTEVSYRLGRLHTFTVDRWILRGIPSKYWDPLMRLAKKRGVEISADQFWAANKKALKNKVR